jgi:hypothetical protein
VALVVLQERPILPCGVERFDQRIVEIIFARPGVKFADALRHLTSSRRVQPPHLGARADYALLHA